MSRLISIVDATSLPPPHWRLEGDANGCGQCSFRFLCHRSTNLPFEEQIPRFFRRQNATRSSLSLKLEASSLFRRGTRRKTASFNAESHRVSASAKRFPRERPWERERERLSLAAFAGVQGCRRWRVLWIAEIKAGTTTYDNAVYPAVLDADTADSIFVAPVWNIDCVLAISRRVNAFRQRCFFPPRAPVLSSDSNASTRPSELPPRVRPDKRSLLIVPCLSLERTFVPPPSPFVSFRFVSFGLQSERCNRDNLQRVFNCVRRVYSSCKMKNYYVFLLEKL